MTEFDCIRFAWTDAVFFSVQSTKTAPFRLSQSRPLACSGRAPSPFVRPGQHRTVPGGHKAAPTPVAGGAPSPFVRRGQHRTAPGGHKTAPSPVAGGAPSPFVRRGQHRTAPGGHKAARPLVEAQKRPPAMPGADITLLRVTLLFEHIQDPLWCQFR